MAKVTTQKKTKTAQAASKAKKSQPDQVTSSTAPKPRRSHRTGQRLRRLPRFKSPKMRRQIRANQPRVGGSFRRLGAAFKTVKRYPKLFLGITLVYALLTILLVRGLGGSVNISELKSTLHEAFAGGQFGTAMTTAALFTSLFSSVGSAGLANGAAYQAILLIVVSLTVIWSLRRVYADSPPTLKEAFYKSMYPLIPFILVVLLIGLQLIPMLIGNWLYAAVLSGGIAVALVEKLMWMVVFLVLVGVSLYWLCASLFALFIVTLPDMTPLQAMRNARQLVRYRRWTILRKILFIPVALFVLAAIIMLPFLLWLPVIAEWVFFVLSLFGWILSLIYMYSLYRELIND